MNLTTIGWVLLLNFAGVAAVESYIAKPLDMLRWRIGQPLPPEVGPRIVNGLEAQEGQFKFMIFILMIGGNDCGLCSSSLVTSTLVLTAAHCFDSPKMKTIILVGGKAHIKEYVDARNALDINYPIDEQKYGVQERFAEKIYIHPKYNKKTTDHDFAVVRANKPFHLGEMITTISVSQEKMKTRKNCTILGWGKDSTGQFPFRLNYAAGVEVLPFKLGCVTAHKELFICLAKKDPTTASGDSGSPLVCDGKAWGVTSHEAFPVGTGPGNGEIFFAEIYVDLDWIMGHINGGHPSSNINLKSLLSCVIISIFNSMKI